MSATLSLVLSFILTAGGLISVFKGYKTDNKSRDFLFVILGFFLAFSGGVNCFAWARSGTQWSPVAAFAANEVYKTDGVVKFSDKGFVVVATNIATKKTVVGSSEQEPPKFFARDGNELREVEIK